MKRSASLVILVVVVLLVAMQFVRPARTNPPTEPQRTFRAHTTNAAAVAVIDRSCRDCHSHETTWPWYSHVAPVSWVVIHDVNDGRGTLNFSEWARYAPDQQRKLLREACEAVTEGEMPGRMYTLAHRTARLTPADVSAVCALSPPEERGES